ncbi:E3 ubiquitin-protein ligase ARI7 [Spatholobus suberectus]|nr:E3 ubiquitin-protein ligase ARI7 [Spatholobus suberectus]
MDSTLDLDVDDVIIDDDSSDLPSMDKEDQKLGKDDYIEGAKINSADYKTTSKEQRHYTILSESDIKRLQDTDINEVSSILVISRVGACLLLIHHEWSVLKVHEAWFDDEERVRKAIGLLKQQEGQVGFPNSKTLTCEICFDVASCDKVRSASCGHPYCILCWKRYVETSIDEGPDKCLKLRCPQPSCDVAVGGDMIHELASESKRNKYDRFLFRSYVENNKKMKWCPAPACEYVVSYEPYDAKTNSDVTCLCYHSICWSCGEEAHSPVDCEIVKHWIKDNNFASENITWILAHTKSCPKCKIPIEKVDGCVHMECKCGFQFCWLCLRDWSKCCYNCHNFSNKDIYREEVKRNVAMDFLETYKHWASNDLSRKNALKRLIKLTSSGHTKRLSMLYQRSEDYFEFIKVAWQQVVECRRVLKWTYPYGYYLLRSEQAKMEFFEFTQREAEATLEKLHHCVQKELSEFLYANEPKSTFNVFRIKLIDLTSSTKNYFENMLKALENRLADVHMKRYDGASKVKRGSIEMGESSSGN